MGLAAWTLVVTGAGVLSVVVGAVVRWMLGVQRLLATLVTELRALKQQILLDAAQHHEEHRRIWAAWQDHEQRIRTVERRE